MDVKGISWSRGDQEGARGVSWNGRVLKSWEVEGEVAST